MKLGVLFSGGKDSMFALTKAMQEHKIACLLAVESENPDSYMFHTPNIRLAKLQSESLGIPLMTIKTKGEKETELDDLKKLVQNAKKEFSIEGVVTGAIASVYQSSRIQKICDELGLLCFNQLWQKSQTELLKELLENKFRVIITRVSAYPFDESFLGKEIDKKVIEKLEEYSKKYKINPAGEGGELETFVIDCPLFKKIIEIKKSRKEFSNNSGIFVIEDARLKNKI